MIIRHDNVFVLGKLKCVHVSIGRCVFLHFTRTMYHFKRNPTLKLNELKVNAIPPLLIIQAICKINSILSRSTTVFTAERVPLLLYYFILPSLNVITVISL